MMQHFEWLRKCYVGPVGNLSMQVDNCVVYVEQTVPCVKFGSFLIIALTNILHGYRIGQR